MISTKHTVNSKHSLTTRSAALTYDAVRRALVSQGLCCSSPTTGTPDHELIQITMIIINYREDLERIYCLKLEVVITFIISLKGLVGTCLMAWSF